MVLVAFIAHVSHRRIAARRYFGNSPDFWLNLQAGYDLRTAERERAAMVAERKAVYTAVRRLYGITPVRGLQDVEHVGVRPLWYHYPDQ